MDSFDFSFFFLGGANILLALEMCGFALELGVTGEPRFAYSSVRHGAARLALMPAISKAALRG
jgi:hypothetical protein